MAQKRLRTAIIGLGEGAERIMLPGLTTLPTLDLVAGCDLNADTRQRMAEKWSLPQTYADPAELIAHEKPDLIAIATPPQTHYAMAKLALSGGCHVFCEKPFMPTLAEADEIIALAQAQGVHLAVNNQYYQMPIFKRVQALIEGGDPGRVFHIEAWQQMYLPPHEEGGWKADLQPRRVLFEFGTHIIDLICRFYGAFPVAVSAQIARPEPTNPTDICITTRLDFPDHRTATLTLNRHSHAPIRYFEMRLNATQTCLRTSLGGLARLDLGWNSEQGRPRVRFSFTKGGELRQEQAGDSRLLLKQENSAFGEATKAHLAEFVAGIVPGREPQTPSHARQIHATMLACYESVNQNGALITEIGD